LHIGNEKMGENPCFFYDNTGHVITLRMIQAAATNAFFTFKFPNSENTYASAEIVLAQNSSANSHRLHMFLVSGSGNEYSSSRRVPLQSMYDKLLSFCLNASIQNQYYVLDGYIDNTTISANTNNWFFKELTSSGGLLWNSTVTDDFVWLWNETLQQLKTNPNVWDHLLYIDPWSEFNGGTLDDVKIMCRNPYLYDGTNGLGNAALISWQNWLESTYHGNISELQVVWGRGTQERWNWTGKETNSFDSLLFSQGAMATSSMRQVDMQLWYNEVVANFTNYCSNEWKKSFPDVYVSWGGYGADVSLPFTGVLSPTSVIFNLAAELNYTDVIDQHWYGSDSDGFMNWNSDYVKYGFAQLAAAGRALKKPIVLGETGFVTSQTVGFDSENRNKTYNYWNNTIQDMIKFGWAGWCPYWYGYYYSLEAARSAVDETNARISTMESYNALYASKEASMEQKIYDPITIVCTYGENFREFRGLEGIFQLFIKAGYNPKYVLFEWDDQSDLPNTIPKDTRVVVLGSGFTSQAITEHTGQLVQDWANNNDSRKIIALYAQERSIHNVSVHFENILNASWFPYSNMAYGVTYMSSDYAHNSTSINVDVSGTSVLIDRTNWYGGYFVDWDYTKIRGAWLINSTNGRYYANIGYEPLVIANDKLAWVNSPLDRSTACLGTYEMLSPNAGLIIKCIMEHFNLYPVG
jgi:hypothetical protein